MKKTQNSFGNFVTTSGWYNRENEMCKIIDAEWEEITDDEPIVVESRSNPAFGTILLGSVILLRFVYCWTMQIVTGVW